MNCSVIELGLIGSLSCILIPMSVAAQQPNSGCVCSAACAQDEGIAYGVKTHSALTRAALSNQLCSVHSFLQEELQIGEGLLHPAAMYEYGFMNLLEWAEEGSIHEDDFIIFPYGRFFHHFHDPIRDQGLQDSGPFPAYDAISWAISHPENEWDLDGTAMHYFASFTFENESDRQNELARTFRGIGQFMHMIEDMAQPAHTRNDPHDPTDSNAALESYATSHYGTPESLVWNAGPPATGLAKLHWFGNATNAPATPPFFVLDNEILPGSLWGQSHSYRYYFDTDQYDKDNGDESVVDFVGFSGPPGLAEYSNFGYFSEDTILNPAYPHPALIDTDIEQAFSLPIGNFKLRMPSSDYDLWGNNQIVYVRKSGQQSLGIDTGYRLCRGISFEDTIVDFWNQAFGGNGVLPTVLLVQDDDLVLDEYCQHLLPKAIAYCTDFANFFFRGRLDADLVGNSDTGLLELTITNLSDGTLTQGTWWLGQDDQNGSREQLAIDWSSYPGWLSPGESFTVSFPPFASTHNGQYTLAFKANGAPGEDFTLEVVAKSFVVPVGACCLSPTGTCMEIEQPECAALGGQSQGEGTTCGLSCLKGACCLPWGCEIDSEIKCEALGGTFHGAGSDCPPTCQSPPCDCTPWWWPNDPCADGAGVHCFWGGNMHPSCAWSYSPWYKFSISGYPALEGVTWCVNLEAQVNAVGWSVRGNNNSAWYGVTYCTADANYVVRFSMEIDDLMQCESLGLDSMSKGFLTIQKCPGGCVFANQPCEAGAGFEPEDDIVIEVNDLEIGLNGGTAEIGGYQVHLISNCPAVVPAVVDCPD